MLITSTLMPRNEINIVKWLTVLFETIRIPLYFNVNLYIIYYNRDRYYMFKIKIVYKTN